jgi:hypothetical protein
MDPIYPSTGAAIGPQNKALVKHLEALQAGTSYELAGLRAVETVEIARLHTLGAIGKAGLGVIDGIATDVRMRAERNPTAAACMVELAGKLTLAIGERFESAARRLG